MTIAAVLGFHRNILVSAVVMLPYPGHRPYALVLLVLFWFLLAAIINNFGWVWSLLFFVAALSIYHYPAIFLVTWIRKKLKL